MNIQCITDKIKNDSVLNNISSFFSENIYLVGGAVRDLFLDKPLYDRDLIVEGVDARDFAQKVCEFFDGVFVPLDEDNKIYRVVLDDKINYLDITNPIENSLEKDLLRRDLSINAVAINIKSGEIVDYCNGLDDLNNKIIRAIDEKNFNDDPLRILRVFRFYSVLGFDIDENLIKICKKYANLINVPAKERIQYELMKLFDGKYCADSLLKMDECAILEKLFPVVKELKKVPPNTHHHLDLFHHSIETVKQIQLLYDSSSQDVQEIMNSVEFGGFSKLAHLKIAGFLHDIGKFSTWTIEQDTGRHRFIKHDDVGAKMCVSILKNLMFSNKQIDYIKTMIKNHIYPSMVMSAPDVDEKIMMRYVRKSFPNGVDNILLAQADRLSARGEAVSEKMVKDNISSLNRLLVFYIEAVKTLEPLPKLLDGNEVMDILGISPSPKLGEILNFLHEAQLNGDVNTKEQAVEFVKKLI